MGLVRLFLALVVVVDHWRVWILTPREAPHVVDSFKLGFNAGYAVMFFYIISGFLITYTLGRNYSHDARGALRFYGNRFIRIFSLYWPLVVVALFVVPGAWSQFVGLTPLKQTIAIGIFGMDWMLSFWAQDSAPFIKGLELAWTLAAELFFYALAPVLMRVSWKVALAVLVVFLAVRLGFVVANGPGFQGLWTYVFPPSAYCFFLLGHVICRAGARYPILSSPLFGAAALAASFAVMTFGPSRDFDSPRFWISLMLFTLSLPGLFESTKDIRWVNALGDLSYPVYLVHGVVLLTAGVALAGVLPIDAPYLSASIVLALIIIAAVAAHWLLEVPVANAMRRVIVSRSTTSGIPRH